jgi:hypothetical protein
MRKIISLFVGCLMVSGAVAAPAGRGRVSMADQMKAAPRATVSKNQISAMAASNPKSSTESAAALAVTPDVMLPAAKDTREKERNACMSNNIGIGNTFVWASRYSNLNNYSSMVEDTIEPENNTCFVKVELASDDSRIDLSGIAGKYFEMGRAITCGAWTDTEDMRQRILDAKKTARVWGTVGASVGGAALGVGAMELFGNKAIGGKVEGQAALSGDQLIRSQVLVLKNDNVAEYNRFISQIKILKEECEKSAWNNTTDSQVKTVCERYSGLFDLASL